VESRCCVPGCSAKVELMQLRLACGPLDVTEGLCAEHLALVAPDRLTLLRAARLELASSPGLAEIVLFVRAWEAVKMSAAERDLGRAA
tara:strand:+ start:148 stop:411 length:264 start_codon:yes stop_codon:yes gene_type:complete